MGIYKTHLRKREKENRGVEVVIDVFVLVNTMDWSPPITSYINPTCR